MLNGFRGAVWSVSLRKVLEEEDKEEILFRVITNAVDSNISLKDDGE